METFSTAQKIIHEHVTDVLKVRVRFLHKFSCRINIRTLSTMYKMCENKPVRIYPSMYVTFS